MMTPLSLSVALAAAVLVLGWAPAVLSASATVSPSYANVEKCGESDRLCLAYPDNCIANKTCELMVTVRRGANNKYLFEMSAQFTGYVAVALAESTSMGVDSVVECINDPKNKDKVVLFQSVNKALNTTTKKRGNRRLPQNEQVGVTLINGTVVNGIISCTFERDLVTTVSGTKYDLEHGSWVLQAAAGNKINSDTSIHHHLEWVVSPNKMTLSSTGLVKDSYGSRRAPSGAVRVATSSLAVVAALVALFSR